MPTSVYDDLFARLDSIPNLVRRPFSDQKLAELERQVGVRAPASIRAWLTHVGLFQDVTRHRDSEFSVLEREADVVNSRQTILDLLGKTGIDLFPFGDDGAGDPVAVRSSPTGDELVLVDHETGKAQRIGSFYDWLSAITDQAAHRAREAEDPAVKKLWRVQFSFATASEDAIVAALREIETVQWLDPAWTSEPPSPAGVHSAHRRFRWQGRARTLKRQTYSGWQAPRFYFDMDESAFIPESDSVIAHLSRIFRSKANLGFKLVDYGPLSYSAKEEGDAE
jgi:hypothetical protein